MPSVVLAAPPVPGQTAPLVRLAHDLVERGHAVTMAAGTAFAAQVQATGARSVALRGAG